MQRDIPFKDIDYIERGMIKDGLKTDEDGIRWQVWQPTSWYIVHMLNGTRIHGSGTPTLDDIRKVVIADVTHEEIV